MRREDLNLDHDARIKVVDSPCGWGKSSYAIQYINSLPDDVKVIYITPFLSETDRIRAECPNRNFKQPDSSRAGTKSADFIKLIEKEENISSTHALFKGISRDLINLLKAKNYILILDEVMNVVEKLDIYKDENISKQEKEALTKNDVQILMDKGMLVADNTGLISWNSKEKILHKYAYLKELADRQLLYYLGNDFLIWTFPIEVFQPNIFKEIYILTYQFDCQIQAYYYNFFNLKYDVYRVMKQQGSYYLVKADKLGQDYDSEWKKKISKLINICNHKKLNSVGDYYKDSRGRTQKSALSKSWYENPENVKKIKKSITNYFINVANCQANLRLWTCFKDNKNQLKGGRACLKNWISCNCRASNEYSNKRCLIYPINRYLNPYYENFFIKRGINIDQDRYALSEMIQWIFRSAIRKGKPIDIYIPSQRMRELFKKWLGGEIQ